jgi:hypothetical protein
LWQGTGKNLRHPQHVSGFILVVLLIVIVTACRDTEAKTLPRYAVHTLRPDDAILVQARDTGADAVVQVFAWREIEPTRDQFHWEMTDQIVAGAEYYGLDLIVRLDHHPAWASDVELSVNAPPDDLEDYRKFVQRVVARYKGRVHAYIIWNEPNLAVEWGGQPPDPAAFTEVLKVGYEAVKTVDPEALVVAPGLAPTNSNNGEAVDERQFLAEMYRAGASAYFDVLAAHPYSFGQAPTVPGSVTRQPSFDRLAELRDIMVENGDARKPVWITEMGWTIAPPPEQAGTAVDLAQQATYLAEALDIIEQEWPWVELITVWNLSIPTADDPFGGYSLLDFAGRPRPVYYAWQQAIGSREARGIPAPQFEPQQRVQILGQDVVIHLGDSHERPPWWPLFGGRKPSVTWMGGFYLNKPGTMDWILLLELMQLNEIGTTVAINGVTLSPDLPQQDYTRRWLTMRRTVPVSLLQPGYNEFTITAARLLPDVQHRNFVWDDMQVRNVRLVRSE